MLNKQAFTDHQGQVFTEAVVEVYQANYNSNKSSYFNTDIVSGEQTTSDNTHDFINCSFLYWVNAKTKKAGAAPYILTARTNGMDDSFNFEPEGVVEDLQKICEEYFVNTVAPSLQAQ